MDGTAWVTDEGLNSIVRVDPSTGKLGVCPAPRGPGPYGMHALRQGPVRFVSLAAGWLGRIDPVSAALAVIALPSEGQGPRRVWLDSKGTPWVSGWYSGKLLHYDPSSSSWTQLDVPGEVWGAESGANKLLVIRY